MKRPEHQVDHSPPTETEVKNEWSYTSTPLISLHDVNTDNFFLLIFLTPSIALTAVSFVSDCVLNSVTFTVTRVRVFIP